MDAIFNNLAQRAAMNMGEYLDATDTYLKLALRAQSQCRSTWEAVSTIKHPPMAGYMQANIAHGPQQVNNSPSPEGGALFPSPDGMDGRRRRAGRCRPRGARGLP